jgi:signal transduction histidine kinase
MNLSTQQWHDLLNGPDSREAVMRQLLSVAPAPDPAGVPCAGPTPPGGQLRLKPGQGRPGAALRLIDVSPNQESILGTASRVIATLDRMAPDRKGPLFIMAEGLAYHFNNLLMGIAGHTALLRLKGQGRPGLAQNLDAVETAIQNGALLVRILVDVFHRPRHHQGTAYPIDLSDDEIGRRIMHTDLLRASALPYHGDPDTQAVLRLVSAGMALRLGELLEVIRQALRAAERLVDPTGRGPRHAGQALLSVERGRRIVRRLSEYAGLRRMHRSACDLHHLVQETVEAFSGCFSGLRFTLTPADGPAVVHGDEKMLRRLLLELFMNASEACENGGQVQVRLERRPGGGPAPQGSAGMLVLTVEDNGGGLPPGASPAAVFTPFFTTRSRQRNLGLGLATALGIVRQHGGRITLGSHLGSGSQVQVCFPEELPPGAA